MYEEDIGCRIMLLIHGEHPNDNRIGTSFGNLHHSKVCKIGNDTSRNRETSKFQTYIDEVKRERPTAIAILLDHMREDTQMADVTVQCGLYDPTLLIFCFIFFLDFFFGKLCFIVEQLLLYNRRWILR
jgi:hypothetical protein